MAEEQIKKEKERQEPNDLEVETATDAVTAAEAKRDKLDCDLKSAKGLHDTALAKLKDLKVSVTSRLLTVDCERRGTESHQRL
jgi:hypothetical protein